MAKRVATDEPGTDMQRGNPQQRGWVWTDNSSRGRGSGWLIFTDESGRYLGAGDVYTRYYALVCLAAQSCPTLTTPWTPVHQTLSMGFSRQEYWSGFPFSSSGDLSIIRIDLCHMHLLHCRWILLPTEPLGKSIRDTKEERNGGKRFLKNLLSMNCKHTWYFQETLIEVSFVLLQFSCPSRFNLFPLQPCTEKSPKVRAG